MKRCNRLLELLRSFSCILTIVFVTSYSSIGYSQTQLVDTTAKMKLHRNELGIDVAGFIKQIFNIGWSIDTYTPNYYLTYRHHFKKSNLRMALGGYGRNSSSESPSFGGSQIYKTTDEGFSIDFRIGYEFCSPIGNKWQVFYGFDLRPSFYFDKASSHTAGSTSTHNMETLAGIYGVAPVLGFRFKITDRFSFIAESSIAFNLQTVNTKDYYSYSTGQSNTGIGDGKTLRFYTSFYQPVSLSFTYDL